MHDNFQSGKKIEMVKKTQYVKGEIPNCFAF